MLHDQFCRCSTCKPPLIGEQGATDTRTAAVFVWAIPLGAVLWAIGYASLSLTGVL